MTSVPEVLVAAAASAGSPPPRALPAAALAVRVLEQAAAFGEIGAGISSP